MRTSSVIRLSLVALLAAAGCADRPVEVSSTGRVHGTLQSARGAGLAGTVRLSGAVEAAVLSDADGAFVFEQVPAGMYLVAATAPDTLEGVATAPVEVSATADTAVALVLTGIGGVEGTVLLDTDDPRAGTRIVLGGTTATTLSAPDGHFALSALPEGSQSLFAVREGWEPAPLGTVEIVRGQVAKLAPVTLAKTSILTTSISGAATVPGATDHAGIEVTIAGTAAAATSVADGSYTIDGVPLGVVSIAFRRGAYTAELAPVLVTSTAPPIVLARKPYPLPTIDLTFGERLPIGATSPTWTAGAKYALWWAPGSAGTPEGLVAYERATGATKRLANAMYHGLHPDKQRVLALRFVAPPMTMKELVSWDPATGDVLVITTDVEAAMLLPQRQEILVVAPTPRVVPLQGGPERLLGDSPISLNVELAADESSLLMGQSSLSPVRWIDIATGALLYSSTTESLLLSKSGKGLFVITQQMVGYRPRGATTTTNLGGPYAMTPVVSIDGRFAVITYGGTTHLWNLETLTEVTSFAAGTSAAFTADSTSLLVMRGNAMGTSDLTVYALPSGVAAPVLVLDRTVEIGHLTWHGRLALYSVINADGSYRMMKIDLDTAQQTVLLPSFRQLWNSTNGRLHFAATLAVPREFQVLDVASGALLPVTYVGVPTYFSSDGTRWTTLESGRVSYVDLTGRHVVLAESALLQDAQPSIFFPDDETVIVNRYQSSYEVLLFPILQIGEGYYVGKPGITGQP